MNKKFPTISLLLKLFDSGKYPEERLSKALLAHTHFCLRKLRLPIEE